MKKEDIHLKPLTPGEVARFTVTERAVCGGRTQFIPTGRIQNSHKLRRGDLWSPVLQHGGSKPPPYGIRLLFSSIHSKKTKKSIAGATRRRSRIDSPVSCQ